MLIHNVPWQAAVTYLFLKICLCIILGIFSLLLGFMGWIPYLAILILAILFINMVQIIPLGLNFTRDFWRYILIMLLVYTVIVIITFTFYYQNWGLMNSEKVYSNNFVDCIYFSIVTWTTLGYGDFCVNPTYRLYAGIEAIFGIASIPLASAFIWLWCQENIVPKERAFLDGNRCSLKSLTTARLKVWTFTGKGKEYDNYVKPEELIGNSCVYNPDNESWEIIKAKEDVKEGDIIVSKKAKKNHT